MDLDDFEHNTRDGVHLAALAGAWIALVQGFGGMRTRDGTLSFAPKLPAALRRISFRLSYRGRRLEITLLADSARYTLLDGPPLELLHDGQPITLTCRAPVCRPIQPCAALPRPSQPHGREAPQRGI